MTLLIKQGRRYVRRDGKIEGPMPEPEWDAHKVAHAFKGPQSGMWYLPDGTVAGFICDDQDLISELEEPSSPESVEDETTEASLVAGEAYQVIGDLALAANLYDHPEVQRALDWFSGFEPRVTYKDDASILPWPKEELKPDDYSDLTARIKVLEEENEGWKDQAKLLIAAWPTLFGDKKYPVSEVLYSALAKKEG